MPQCNAKRTAEALSETDPKVVCIGEALFGAFRSGSTSLEGLSFKRNSGEVCTRLAHNDLSAFQIQFPMSWEKRRRR